MIKLPRNKNLILLAALFFAPIFSNAQEKKLQHEISFYYRPEINYLFRSNKIFLAYGISKAGKKEHWYNLLQADIITEWRARNVYIQVSSLNFDKMRYFGKSYRFGLGTGVGLSHFYQQQGIYGHQQLFGINGHVKLETGWEFKKHGLSLGYFFGLLPGFHSETKDFGNNPNNKSFLILIAPYYSFYLKFKIK